MSSLRYLTVLLFAGAAQAEGGGYLFGGGLETDSDGGVRGAVLASVGLSKETWLSGSASFSRVELATGRDSDTRYGDIELDHLFDSVGITIGAAYWGDPDILDSVDLRASLYFRGDRVMLAAEYESRDFDFIIPPTDLFSGREFTFDADGVGVQARFELNEVVSMGLSGMKYDYSVDFRPDENRDAISLISVSRLSPINTLIDSIASIDFGFDVGLKRWELDFGTWKSVLDQSRSRSLTVRYLTPLSKRTDIEFSLGYDDSELYGDVTYFSVYVYLYGT